MTVYWLSPVPPGGTISGGTRKLWDLDAILNQNGIPSKVITPGELAGAVWEKRDLVVVPEVFGHGLDTLIPHPVKRVSFVQNGYLMDIYGRTGYGIGPGDPHPLAATADLVAILTESDHTTTLVQEKQPTVPVIRTHSSGNGRMGHGAGFHYGSWPRRKRVLYFQYKNGESWNGADVLGPIFSGLTLREGWELECLTGRTDEEIAAAMRTAAIFVAPNRMEGMCAPTSEAMISGCVIVGWTGGGTDEYLPGRAVVAPQDDVAALRDAITDTVTSVDFHPERWARKTAAWSRWFRRTYSRPKEIAEIVQIMTDLQR